MLEFLEGGDLKNFLRENRPKMDSVCFLICLKLKYIVISYDNLGPIILRSFILFD